MADTDKTKKNIIKNIKKINIIVETNIEGEATFSLTYDKIYNPIKSRVIKSQTKLNYPYFTPDIEYDEEVLYNLTRKDYSELLRTFFDKKYFIKMVDSFYKEKRQNAKRFDQTKNEDKNKIINHNIFMMLYFLFPTRFPISSNITSSYNSKICANKDANYIVNLTNVNSSNTISSGLFGFTKRIGEENIREYSYINTSKGISTVTGVVWLNDILNEPEYRKLIDILIEYDELYEEEKLSIDNEIKYAYEKFSGYERGYESLIFDNNDKSIIEAQLNKIDASINENAGDYRYISNLKEIRFNIQKGLDEINKFNIQLDKVSKEDKEKSEGIFKEMMNSIEFLNRFFSDKNVEKNKLTGVSSIKNKVEKNFLLLNKINSLNLVKSFLFGESKGINIFYDKYTTDTKRNAEILNELKKEKYSFFTNTVKFIKDKFTNIKRETTNDDLNNMMKNYFNNTSNDFMEQVVREAKQVINSNDNPKCNPLWNILVTKSLPSTDQNNPEYEIKVYMEVIKGEMNYETQQNIKCDYRDQNLTVLFNELNTNPNVFEVVKKTSAVELPKEAKGDKQNVQKKTLENPSLEKNPLEQSLENDKKNLRGGYKRKTRKIKRKLNKFTSRNYN